MEPKEFEALLKETEKKLDRLKALYEQYFQGMERLEPLIVRKEVQRRVAALRKSQPRQTALRFRFQSLAQRYSTFQQYWNRTCRQIEEGTYRRHVLRARRRAPDAVQQRPAEAEDKAVELQVSLDDIGGEVEAALAAAREYEPPRTSERASAKGGDAHAPVSFTFSKPKERPLHAASEAQAVDKSREGVRAKADPGKSRAAIEAGSRAGDPKRRPQPPAPPKSQGGRPSGLTDRRLKQLYSEYVEARRRNNERVDNLRYDKLASSIEKMVPKLKQKHGDKKIDFKVVVKGGRVGIKPVTED